MNHVYDIIVVGSGLAGLTVVVNLLNLANSNQKILLLEKEENLGGNSAKATSGINLIGTQVQKDRGIYDSEKLFLKDTLESSGGLGGIGLKNKLTSVVENRRVQEFLEKVGVRFIDVVKCGGHSVPRTHCASFGIKKPGKNRNTGWEIISAMISYLEKYSGNITLDIKKSYQVTDLQLLGSKVDTVVTTDLANGSQKIFRAKCGIVLTSGGFSANHDLVKKYFNRNNCNNLYYTTNGKFAQGDLLEISEQVNAKLVDLDQIQLHPTGFVHPEDPESHHKFLAPEAFRGLGGILIDPVTGSRFVDELTTRDQVTGAFFNNLSNSKYKAIMVLNKEIVDKFGSHLVGFYLCKGLVKKVDSLSELSKELEINSDILKESLKSLLVLSSLSSFELSELYYMNVTPVVHYTMGGLAINTRSQVLDQNNYPIPGLYAAGEVTGGVHGINRLAGNSLLECVIFGLTVTENFFCI